MDQLERHQALARCPVPQKSLSPPVWASPLCRVQPPTPNFMGNRVSQGSGLGSYEVFYTLGTDVVGT